MLLHGPSVLALTSDAMRHRRQSRRAPRRAEHRSRCCGRYEPYIKTGLYRLAQNKCLHFLWLLQYVTRNLWLKTTNLLSYSSGVQTPENRFYGAIIKVSADLRIKITHYIPGNTHKTTKNILIVLMSFKGREL